MTIEYVLEILSGAWSILLLCLEVFLVVYFVDQWRRNQMTWRGMLALPLGMAVALSLFVQAGGAFGSRATVWFWRHFQGGEPLTALNIQSLTVSAFVASIGILMTIRVLSRPIYGELPWIISAALTIIYIAGALLWKI